MTFSKVSYWIGAACLFLMIACGRSGSDADDPNTAIQLPDLQEILARDTLKAITMYSSTSYFIYRGQPMGYEYEMLNDFAESLGVELQMIVAEDLEEMFIMLEEGKGDLIAHGLTVIKSRQERMSFSTPLMTTRQVLIQRKPEGWQRMNNRRIERNLIRDLTELEDKKIIVGRSTAFKERLANLSEELGVRIDVVLAPGKVNSEELIKMVSAGNIDYTVADEHVAMLNATFMPNIDVKTPVSLKQHLAWAVRPKSTNLLDTLNAWISGIDGTLAQVMRYNRYFKYRKDFSRKIKSEFYAQREGKLSPYDELIRQYADSLGWDWRLLASQVYQESKFDPQAQSWSGAAGLMQLMPETAYELGVVDLADPQASLSGGVAYLKDLDEYWSEISDEEERIKFVLASYNVGPYHVRDAQRLAKKYGVDYCKWDDNVAFFLLQKSKPEYYNDEVVKNGYCRGVEPVAYVKEILQRHNHYTQLLAGI